MRSVLLVTAIVGALFTLSGTASAAVVSGSQWDGSDDAFGFPHSGGTVDVKRVSARYDAVAGSVVFAFEAHNTFDNWFQTHAALGFVNPSGQCEAGSQAGSVTLTSSYAPDYSQTLFHSAQIVGGESLPSSVTHGSDWRVLTQRVSHSTLKRRAYDCIGDVWVQTYTYGADAVDRTRPFCIGTCSLKPDTTPPKVRWIRPANGATVSGVFTEGGPNMDGRHDCLVEATDSGSGVAYTENYIDGRRNDTQVNVPYSCEWDTRTVPDGRHILMVRAWDQHGNSRTSSIVVNVDNVY